MAQSNLQNTSNTSTNATSKAGLITDLNPTYIQSGQYSYARNAVRASKDGDLGTIGNEPSNGLCFTAPYKITGTVDLPDGKILVFSTDNVKSEIGIGDPELCSYTTVKNLDCLNFNQNSPITGVSKSDFQKGTLVYFTDKRNPVRRVQLNKLAALSNCDDILLFKNIEHPCIEVSKGQTGNMPNGSYSVVVAYVVDNQIFSDWYSITNRIQLYSETQANSLNVKISNLDKEFKQFALVVVGNYIDPATKGVTKTARRIGVYSTKVTSIPITDFINADYPIVQLSDLVLHKKSWLKAGILASNSNYLLLADLVTRDEENYQLKAMQIKSEYVVKQVEADYYANDGQDVGYYRDENYDFYIQGVYKTGELTDRYHIPGPAAKNKDLAVASSADVYEHDTQFKDCQAPGKILNWQINNTAGDLVPYSNDFTCSERILGRGDMGYWASTVTYPDNSYMFGEKANKQQQFHKMPDECKVPRYSVINGKEYINILGIRFRNVPKFDNPDIIGYKITRSDRKGGNGTVIARGIMTNVRSYHDKFLNQDVYYSNYTVNDLGADQYLSSTQTAYKSGTEKSYTPLTAYHTDKFSFYSPHTLFEPRYSLGNEVKIESEEVATITGNFEKAFKHPRERLMNQFAFWLAAGVGFMETALVLLGSVDISSKSGLKIGIDGGPYYELSTGNIKIETVDDLLKLSVVDVTQTTIDAIKTLDPTKIGTIVKLIEAVILTVTTLGLKVAYSAFSGIKKAEEIFNTIVQFTGFTDYAYQYNSHAVFNSSNCITEGNKRRRLLRDAKYVPSTVVTVNDKIFNNLNREKCVFLELNKKVIEPRTQDTSRRTIGGFGICGDIEAATKSIGSAYYASSKIANPNQYGELGSALPVSIHSCVLSFEGEATTTPILFGGDCVIARFQFMKTMPFFSQDLTNTNYPDGVEYDYRKYRNIAYPRYWADFTKYDFSELLSGNVVNFTKFSRTTTSKHNLDCKKSNDGKSISRIDDAYFYLSNNCVMDFFVECDYNINFRERTTRPFYSKNDTNLSHVFRSDFLTIPEEFVISRAYSDLYTTEIFSQQQRPDFTPDTAIPPLQPNSVIYSLPSFNTQEVDNWQYFLPANWFAFKDSDFGTLTAIHKIDQDRLIFLFSQASPYISMGRSLLELNGQTVTIGDGGLFAQDPRELLPTDNNYSASTSRFAFSNTHLGRFFPSSNQGRIISFAEGLDDITRAGMSYWCKNYMPIFLYQYFRNYPRVENPISGVGYLTAFDSFSETVYICKRDFSPKVEYANDIIWDGNASTFRYRGAPIALRDRKYFNDISWTLSYSPIDKAFVSWHDWHPDWVIQRDNHFMTVKDRGVWKHNERYDSFCNFYGENQPFEIEFISSSGQQIEVARSLEYILEVYKYKNFGRDRFHVHHENFDRLIVSNTEQISPLLALNYSTSNPEEDILYPKINTSTDVTYDILYTKEENKYRINQFWDSVKDRGEFSRAEYHLMPTDGSGYRQVINPLAIDIHKPEEERKKFRHYYNKFRLTKTVSGENKFICKLSNVKKVISQK